MAEEGPSLELPHLAEFFRDFVHRIASGEDEDLKVEFARQSLPPPPSEAREERLVIRKGVHFYELTRFDIALFYGSKEDYCGLGVAILSALFHRTELAVHLAHPASEIRRLVVDGASGWQVEPILCDVGALTSCAADSNRGSAWQSKGEYDKAIADYDRVIELDPEDADAYFSRGDVWDIKGEYEKAIADCSRAIDLEPDNADAYNQLAWLRSTCPESGFRDAQAAIENASRACELTNWQDWNILDTLAAAYAETGDFESAVCWVTKALELDPETEKAVEQNRLELYQSGTPYREE